MLLNDNEIKELAINHKMIEPFSSTLIRTQKKFGYWEWDTNEYKVLSYGLGSFGYDITLSEKEFKVFRRIPGHILDPKNFNPNCLEDTELTINPSGNYFILPAHSYGLGVAVECLNIPNDVTAICMGKSTYARCGVIANITPVEAGWKGHLTLEFSNSSSADCRIYANEGIVQLLFLKGNPCSVSYEDRSGKYQGQSEKITIAKV
jgi:dCTP deaminase